MRSRSLLLLACLAAATLAVCRADDDAEDSGSSSSDDSGSGSSSEKPKAEDSRSNRHVRKQYDTEHRSQFVKPTYLPLRTLDELKVYTDFLKKIATEFDGIHEVSAPPLPVVVPR